MKKMYVFMAMVAFSTTAVAQTLLLTENFDYPAGAQLRDHGWNPHSAAATNPQTVVATGLSLGNTVYFGNSIGGAALVNNTGPFLCLNIAVNLSLPATPNPSIHSRNNCMPHRLSYTASKYLTHFSPQTYGSCKKSGR